MKVKKETKYIIPNTPEGRCLAEVIEKRQRENPLSMQQGHIITTDTIYLLFELFEDV